MIVPTVAIVGRPNVGKSALFNRIVGGHAAIVSDEPGTTRDRHFARAEWAGQSFWLVDTGGLVEDAHLPMDVAIKRQVLQAIDEADLLLLVVDAKTGLHPSDQRIVELLREAHKPWLLVANKVDDPMDADFYEFYELGAGDPVPVSAANGKNSGDLLDAIVERIPSTPSEDETVVRVAVVGRPNVGKSSLVNRLLGTDRLIVADEPGTTRDAIDSPMLYHGHALIFIDTAGLRRQSKVEDGVEFYSMLRSRRAIERSDVCILVLDATSGLSGQDLKIAALAWEAGRGLIIAVNKWDLKEKDDKTAAKFEKECAETAPYLGFVPFVFISALTGQRVTRILDIVLEVAAERQKRVPTAQINATLEQLVARRQPPQAAGHQDIRLLYATQVEVAPPTIAVFGTRTELLQDHYVRYLQNGFRAAWGWLGNPLRIVMRQKAA
jgi:GTP-binding protein